MGANTEFLNYNAKSFGNHDPRLHFQMTALNCGFIYQELREIIGPHLQDEETEFMPSISILKHETDYNSVF